MAAVVRRAAASLAGRGAAAAQNPNNKPGSGRGGGHLAREARRRLLATDAEYRDRAPVDAFFVSDTPDATEPGRLYRRFPVAVGASLRVSAPAGVAAVDVRVGQLEEIAVQVLCSRGSDLSEVMHISERGGRVEATGGAEEGPDGLNLTAWVPERFCTVDVSALGADVTVKSVIEASLTVHSGGGSVTLGTIRASDAAVHTGGGALQGSISAYTISVDTAGGPLALKRLVGRNVTVSSGGGPTDLRVVYGDNISVLSGGGSISINSMKVAHSAELRSSGGAVSLAGADGVVDINSAGGPVDVQMHAEAQRVAISSEGGSVSLSLPSSCKFQTAVEAQGGVSLDSQLDVVGERTPTRVAGALRATTAPAGRKSQAVAGFSWREAGLKELNRMQDPGSASSEEGLGVLQVDAGGGHVAIKVESWMDSLAKKFSAPKEE